MSKTMLYNGMKPVELNITGGVPDAEEAARLAAMPFEKQPVSAEERNSALKNMAIALIGAVVLWFLGGWVISGFKGPGVLIFGYGAKYLGTPVLVIMAVVFFSELFRSAKKKNVKDAMNWIWKISIVGELSDNCRFSAPNYALATLKRIIPQGRAIPSRELEEKIALLRDAIGKAADITAIPGKEVFSGWNQTSPQVGELTVREQRELYPNVKQVQGSFTYVDRLCMARNNDTDYMHIATVHVNITQVFVFSDGGWFPYDIPTAFEIIPPADMAEKEKVDAPEAAAGDAAQSAPEAAESPQEDPTK